jgi:hypothetical protein
VLSKCANPSCSTPLVYLREGKVFMMENSVQTGNRIEIKETKPKSIRRVEHFWLCGPCSENLTLTYDGKQGVRVIPKKFRASAAAS